MAKSKARAKPEPQVRQRIVYAPPRTDVYVGMIFLTALAMAVGCGLLAYEVETDYGWKQPPKVREKIGPPPPKSAEPVPDPAADPAAPPPADNTGGGNP